MGVLTRGNREGERPHGQAAHGGSVGPAGRGPQTAPTRLVRIVAALIGAVLGVALVCAPAVVQAQAPGQVYKWVDAQGRTHYSSSKPTDPATRPTEIKPPPPAPLPPPAPPKPSTSEDWPPRPAYRPVETPQVTITPSPPAPPRALSSGMNRETDAYRCALAKDVLSGAVRRWSRPTDDHDRKIAHDDIKLFCK